MLLPLKTPWKVLAIGGLLVLYQTGNLLFGFPLADWIGYCISLSWMIGVIPWCLWVMGRGSI